MPTCNKVIERVLKRHDIWSDLHHYNTTWLLYEKIDFRGARLGGPNNGQLQLSRKEMAVAHTRNVTKTIKMVSGYILEVELKGTAGTE